MSVFCAIIFYIINTIVFLFLCPALYHSEPSCFGSLVALQSLSLAWRDGVIWMLSVRRSSVHSPVIVALTLFRPINEALTPVNTCYQIIVTKTRKSAVAKRRRINIVLVDFTDYTTVWQRTGPLYDTCLSDSRCVEHVLPHMVVIRRPVSDILL